MEKVSFSLVVPVFNEEAVIEETTRRLTGVMDALDEPFEIIYINDGRSEERRVGQ